MKETRITCLCQSLHLPDLGLNLVKGQVVFVDTGKARKSVDLDRAQRGRGVAVQDVERSRERRAQPLKAPPVARKSPTLRLVPTPTPEPVVTPPPAAVDLTAVAEMVNKQVREALEGFIGAPHTPVVAEKVKEAVGDVLEGVLKDEPAPTSTKSAKGRKKRPAKKADESSRVE